MPANSTILLASPDPELLTSFEPALVQSLGPVEVVLSAQAALAALKAPSPPSLAILDTTLPGMEVAQLVAAVRTEPTSHDFPLVLISDTVASEWLDRLAEGVIDDLLPRSIDTAFLLPRIHVVLRARKLAYEMELLREASALNRQIDRLTGIYNRDAMMAMLFRETDRAQRLKNSLSLILFDIDDFGHWNSRLGSRPCDQLLRQITTRTTRLLRSYDLLGRVGKDEFLVAMPGCGSMNAVSLAERLRQDVFSAPFHLEQDVIRLSACFGISSSQGRSPVVVLRQAEQALQLAKVDGPESIQCFIESLQPSADPVTFLSPTSGENLLAW